MPIATVVEYEASVTVRVRPLFTVINSRGPSTVTANVYAAAWA
jgi:hypothetical protein